MVEKLCTANWNMPQQPDKIKHCTLPAGHGDLHVGPNGYGVNRNIARAIGLELREPDASDPAVP